MVEVAFLIVMAIALLAVWLWKRKAALENQLAAQIDKAHQKNSLHSLIEGTVGTTGETFFYGLTRELSKYLSVDAVLIAEGTGDKSGEFKSIAFWCDHGYIMNQPVSLQHAPFESSDGLCYLETDACQLFPDSTLLHEPFNAAAFLSIKSNSCLIALT